jgi:hypothetical protein
VCPYVPIVVSVPIKNKCLSLSDTKDIKDLVGAPLTTAALVVKAAGSAAKGLQVNVLPFLTVATSTWP